MLVLDQIETMACWNISYGLYIVSAQYENKKAGFIANTVFQVTSQPIMLAVSVNKNNFTYDVILQSGYIGVSVLEQDTPMTFIGTWGFKSGTSIDKFKGANYLLGKFNSPLVTDYSVSIMELKLLKNVDLGSHSLFVGEITCSKNLKDAKLLTYDFYQKDKKGKAPKNAPTYKGK